MNKVASTLGNGVHVLGNCAVFLEKNIVDGSLKSNIVLEGPNNIENFVFQNQSSNARGEGIFLIHCENFTLQKNTITNNYNGIVSLTGV